MLNRLIELVREWNRVFLFKRYMTVPPFPAYSNLTRHAVPPLPPTVAKRSPF